MISIVNVILQKADASNYYYKNKHVTVITIPIFNYSITNSL